MKPTNKTYIVLLIVTCNILTAQFAASQANPQFIFKHEDINGYIGGLAFSHDHTKLLTTGGRHAMMWDLKTGEKIMTLPEYSGYHAIDFSTDDKMIVTSHVKNANVAIWDAQSGDEIKTIQGEIDLTPPPNWYSAVSFTNDGKKILAGDDSGGLYVIDIDLEKVVQKFKQLGGYVRNIQPYPDGDRVVVSRSIISLNRGDIIKTFDNLIYLSFDKSELYSISAGNITDFLFRSFTMSVWDSNKFEKKKEFPSFIARNQSTRTISPHGDLVIFTGNYEQGSVSKELPRAISLETSETVRTFAVAGKQDIIFDKVKFSRDGKMVAFVKDDTVYLYDISDLTAGISENELK